MGIIDRLKSSNEQKKKRIEEQEEKEIAIATFVRTSPVMIECGKLIPLIRQTLKELSRHTTLIIHEEAGNTAGFPYNFTIWYAYYESIFNRIIKSPTRDTQAATIYIGIIKNYNVLPQESVRICPVSISYSRYFGLERVEDDEFRYPEVNEIFNVSDVLDWLENTIVENGAFGAKIRDKWFFK